MMCTRCNKQPAEGGYKRCNHCRLQQRRNTAAYYARHNTRHPERTRTRAIRMLSTFVLSPLELADAIRITPEHAAVVLCRLYQQGQCVRFVSGKLWNGKPKVRYRLRDV